MIRVIFYGCALFSLGAALLTAIVDCAKSVAFAKLSFTSVTDFLANSGAVSAAAAREAGFIYQILYYTPVWLIFLIAASLFYQLSYRGLHLWTHWRHRFAHFSFLSRIFKPLQHKN